MPAVPRGKKQERDPLRKYQEWMENRYNPGYWTGGRVPPDVQGVWSTRDRKLVGWVFIASSVLGMAYSLRQVTRETADEILVLASLVAIPFLAIGVMLVLNLPKPSPKSRKARPPDDPISNPWSADPRSPIPNHY